MSNKAIAAKVAAAMVAAPSTWLVKKFNGDFWYTDWQATEKKIKEFLVREFKLN